MTAPRPSSESQWRGAETAVNVRYVILMRLLLLTIMLACLPALTRADDRPATVRDPAVRPAADLTAGGDSGRARADDDTTGETETHSLRPGAGRTGRGASSPRLRPDEDTTETPRVRKTDRERRRWHRPVIIDRERAPPADPPEDATPAEKDKTVEPSARPPDPGGEIGRYPARGWTPLKQWTVGQILPPRLPHVKLSYKAYGLPKPPDGQIYARVRGDVLLIDAVTRRVISEVRK